MPEYAIEAVDVVKRYPFKRSSSWGGRSILKMVLGLDRANMVALNKASFQVKKGETFGLLGPNGAGKTTMIKILSTLLTFEEGEVKVNGVDLKRHPGEVLKNLQTVLTGSRGFEWRLTARQSLEFYATLYGLGGVDAKKRIEELFDLTGLRGFEEVTFQHYSSGMARRLLLARALLVDVPILLFDEPTANLDPNNAVKFRDLMKSLTKSKGKTVLFATHNMFEAQELCDSIAIMDKGRVAAVGSPDEIRHLFGRKMKIVMGVRFPDEASESQLIDAVQDYPKVLGVSVRRNGAESSKLTIEAGIDLDINDLLRSILANDVVVQTLETSYPSLEDAFVALTAEDTK